MRVIKVTDDDIIFECLCGERVKMLIDPPLLNGMVNSEICYECGHRFVLRRLISWKLDITMMES